MNKEEITKIRGALLMKGLTFTSIAEKFRASKQAVSLAVREERNSTLSKEIRNYINDITKEDADD